MGWSEDILSGEREEFGGVFGGIAVILESWKVGDDRVIVSYKSYCRIIYLPGPNTPLLTDPTPF